MGNRLLSVGINDYAARPLAWAVNDATELANCLGASDVGYSVDLLTDERATRPAVLEGIRRLAGTTEGNRVLYLAGHAALESHGARFIPYGPDGSTLSGSVAFTEIAAILKAGLSPKAPLVVILDCCHAGAMEIDSTFTTQELRDAVNQNIGHSCVASLLACTVGSSAREEERLRHGIFTYHLLQGLAGSTGDSDGAITPESLYSHIAKQLERHSCQKPSYKASVAGRVVLVRRPSAEQQQKAKADISADLAKLRELIDQTDATLGALRPPASTRDHYRAVGWQQAAKAIQVAAEKRNAVSSRWGELLEQWPTWRSAREDVDGLLRDIANISTGTVTEFGRVTEKLGEGGFGSVYRVQADGGPLAYKVFHPTELASTAKLERFRIGYRAMNLLSHPRIVKVSKFVESPLSFYMTFVDGQNLRKGYGVLGDDAAEVVRVLGSIVQTVEYAHGIGVIHRDIKPENVILSWDADRSRWEPCLTDFDLAWFPAATSHTVEAFGAPFYAAPEQLTSPGKSAAHQPAVDVYALAMLAMFMLTGRDPVAREEALVGAEVAMRRWNSPKAAELLLAKLRCAAERDPSRRGSISELRDALIRAAELLSEAADPNAPAESEDFLAHVERLLGYERRESKPTSGSSPFLCGKEATYTSSSQRTEVIVRIVDGGLDVIFRRLDRFLAEGTTTNEARVAMLRRLDGRLAQIRADQPAGMGIDRRGGATDIRFEFRNAMLSRATAAFIARATAEIVSVCELF